MKIVIDKHIPFIQGVFEPYAEVVYAASESFTSRLVSDADALIIRTRTRCDAHLLSHSQVKFIATATIGYDHVDADYCARHDIAWTSAQGCNADAVVEYVETALRYVEQQRQSNLRGKVLGVVGVGNIGRQIVAMGERLGMRVLQNDPPRQQNEKGLSFVSLKEIALRSDFITFHTPLCLVGEHRTKHLCSGMFIAQLKSDAVLINAARGGVVDEEALKEAPHIAANAIIDCWEHEPEIDAALSAQVAIATSHIAGYSLQGKLNATTMSVRAVAHHFDIEALKTWEATCERKAGSSKRQYDIMADCEALRQDVSNFEHLRSTYPLR